MQKAISSTLLLFPLTLSVTCTLAAIPFTMDADCQRLAAGQSATLIASGTNGANPGWRVTGGTCTVPSSGNPGMVTPPAGPGTQHCEIEGSITLLGGRSSVSKTFDWSSFVISASPNTVTPHQLVSLTTQPPSPVNWSIFAPVSYSRSLSGPSSQLQMPIEPSACQQEVWTFRGQNPFDASDYSEAQVSIGCPLGMTWYSIAGFEQGQAAGSDRILRLFVDLGVNFPFPYRSRSHRHRHPGRKTQRCRTGGGIVGRSGISPGRDR
jgi:hypothetical protein